MTLEKGAQDVEIVSELEPCALCQGDMSLFEGVHNVSVTVYYYHIRIQGKVIKERF